MNHQSNTWQSDDPTWMASKTEEWKLIQQRLSHATDLLPRKYWKHLKAFFLYGTPMPEFNVHDGGVYREFCRWWLHPDVSQLEHFEYRQEARNARRLFSTFYGFLTDAIRTEGDSVYGVMGGREQLIMLALNPGYNCQEEIDIPNGLYGGSCEVAGSLIENTLQAVKDEIGPHNKRKALSGCEDTEPHIAYQRRLVLWDHVSKCMEQPDYFRFGLNRVKREGEWHIEMDTKNKEIIERKEQLFDTTLMRVLTFFDRVEESNSRQRPQTVAHVEYLLERFESKDFSDPLMERWERSKSLIKPGRVY